MGAAIHQQPFSQSVVWKQRTYTICWGLTVNRLAVAAALWLFALQIKFVRSPSSQHRMSKQFPENRLHSLVSFFHHSLSQLESSRNNICKLFLSEHRLIKWCANNMKDTNTVHWINIKWININYSYSSSDSGRIVVKFYACTIAGVQ